MAIQVIYGIPGSGKTYYAIWYLLQMYYQFISRLRRWVPKSGYENLEIYTNIDDLVIDNVRSLQHEFEVAGGFEVFCTKEYQEKFLRQANGGGYRRCVYIWDEAHAELHSKFYNKDVFYFFRWHRHFGLDIYLICAGTDEAAIPKAISSLCLYTVEAIRATHRFTKSFRYRFWTGGEKWKSISIAPNSSIFSLYKSFNQKESAKVGSLPARILMMLLVACLCAAIAVGVVARIFTNNGKIFSNGKQVQGKKVVVASNNVSGQVPIYMKNSKTPSQAVVAGGGTEQSEKPPDRLSSAICKKKVGSFELFNSEVASKPYKAKVVFEDCKSELDQESNPPVATTVRRGI